MSKNMQKFKPGLSNNMHMPLTLLSKYMYNDVEVLYVKTQSL